MKTKSAKQIRSEISMVCWLFSVPGFIFSFYLLVIPHAMMAVLLPLEAIVNTEFYKAAAVVFSWTALIKMTTAWVHDEPISKLLVVFGTVTGIACAAFFLEFIILAAPCGLLGIYLFFYHLFKKPSA